MKKIYFEYWTDLMNCGCGGNVGGKCSIELNDADAQTLKDALLPARETRDMLAYFDEHLPKALSENIRSTITNDFKFVTAGDAFDAVGMEVFSEIPEGYEKMSRSELLERLVSETDYSDMEFTIVDIEITCTRNNK